MRNQVCFSFLFVNWSEDFHGIFGYIHREEIELFGSPVMVLANSSESIFSKIQACHHCHGDSSMPLQYGIRKSARTLNIAGEVPIRRRKLIKILN